MREHTAAFSNISTAAIDTLIAASMDDENATLKTATADHNIANGLYALACVECVCVCLCGTHAHTESADNLYIFTSIDLDNLFCMSRHIIQCTAYSMCTKNENIFKHMHTNDVEIILIHHALIKMRHCDNYICTQTTPVML